MNVVKGLFLLPALWPGQNILALDNSTQSPLNPAVYLAGSLSPGNDKARFIARADNRALKGDNDTFDDGNADAGPSRDGGANALVADAGASERAVAAGLGADFQMGADAAAAGASILAPAQRALLALDLDGDGIETRGTDGRVVFDHHGDGLKTGTGWAHSDDGLLVLDRNSNGTIDNGGELFGVDTTKSDGKKPSDGFDALSDLDSNKDGMFDARDTRFKDVRVWRDLNQDGVSQSKSQVVGMDLPARPALMPGPDELSTLSANNIRSISLSKTSARRPRQRQRADGHGRLYP